MSVLLSDEAMRAVGGLPREQDCLETFLRYHATEGREALVQRVAEVIFDDWVVGSHGRGHFREAAEAVVTALFEEPS